MQAPVVRHDHYPPLGQCGGDGDDRTWALSQHRVQGVVGLLLGFKVKKGVLTEQDEVIALSLQKDLLGGETNILEDLAGDIGLSTAPCTVLQKLLYFVAGVREEAGIMMYFVGASPNRHGLWLTDCRGIDNSQPYEHSARALRPLDAECHCGGAVRRSVHTNQHAP